MFNDIKIIRLNDGEDIITEYIIDDKTNSVIMNNPMVLFFKRMNSGKSVVMLGPWLPAELIESNSVKVSAHKILTMFEPKEALIEYYLSSVDELTEMIEYNAETIEESLLKPFEEESSEEEPSESSKGHILH